MDLCGFVDSEVWKFSNALSDRKDNETNEVSLKRNKYLTYEVVQLFVIPNFCLGTDAAFFSVKIIILVTYKFIKHNIMMMNYDLIMDHSYFGFRLIN